MTTFDQSRNEPGEDDRAARIRALADEVLAAHAGEPGWAFQIADLVDRDDSTWRSCCAGACDPCVFTLGHYVDAVRARLAASDAD